MKNLFKIVVVLFVIGLQSSFAQDVIPFKIIKKLPVIEVLVNGKQAYLLIDTGASISLMDSGGQKYFKYYTVEDKYNKYSAIGGVGGNMQIERVQGFVMTIQGIEIEYFQYAVNLEAVRTKVRGVVGILGSDYLAKQGYVVDFVNNQLRKLTPQNLVVAN